MPENEGIPLHQVLADEFAVLRPDSGFADAPQCDLFRKVHSEARPLSALCISGGGIRSATFALGAIQGLAEQGLLGTFDYLSTVSGGGYIGSWLTAWKQREGGLDKITPFLRRRARPIAEGAPDPIQHLREYNSYLSPKLGLFSADTWTLAATVSRNIFLNWLVFLPLLMAALMVPRIMLSIARLGETWDLFYGSGSGRMLSDILPLVLPVATGLLFAAAVFNMMLYLPGVGGRQHTDSDFLRWVLLPLVGAALLFIANDSWFTGGDSNGEVPQLIGFWRSVGGANVAAVAGWFAYFLVCGKSAKERIGLLRVSLAVTMSATSAAIVAWMLSNYFYPNTSWPVYTTFAAPLMVLAVVFAGCLFVGFTSYVLKDDDREWLSRAGAWLLLFVVAWLGICGLVLLLPGAYFDRWYSTGFEVPGWMKALVAAAGTLGGGAGALGGASTKTAAHETESGAGPAATAPASKSWLQKMITALAAPVFVIAVVAGLAAGTDWLLGITRLGSSAAPSMETIGKVTPCPNCAWWDHQAMLEGTRWESVLILALAFLVIGVVMARFININKFSLHAMYRNRLIRAYLGASNPTRQASEFTGFAENDNILMSNLDTRLKPFHIVNVTLNLVSGQRLAWQQRKAESFTISPLHSGSAELQYRPSSEYGGGISLGTAVTISGAAASPNMGYNSSPVIGFIMTLFNARLGSWLGNPGSAGAKTWRNAGPTSAVSSLIKEAFGLTNDTNEWVNLSDGGHFENLAFYEMVRRRCRFIVVLDGGCDPAFTYGDLGNAIRKIRIDLKIPIDFDERLALALRKKEQRFAVARICYSSVDGDVEDGYLLYIKPMIRGNEPPDVASYHCDNPVFPHESTADQFFDESQTESYRALGSHTISEICSGWDQSTGLAGLIKYLRGVQTTVASAI